MILDRGTAVGKWCGGHSLPAQDVRRNVLPA
jgi:hypothetical protein